MSTELPDLEKPYDPSSVESRWYEFWEKNHVFEANDDDDRDVYVIPMPPPNVTGSLHMGHAQRCTLEDVLIRYHRMRGFNTLWQPGIDHAGIATQTVVERQLIREGKTRHDLGREKFLERVWEWKKESGGRIAMQQRVLGASPDWRRSKFTMDADMNRAVVHAFVTLFEQGLMYRATRLINWCPECQTALSDLEVENEEGANGEMFEFAYKIDGAELSGREIVVATTRPETMLGDTAVAVHPDDPRYKDLHGKMLVHPFVDRKIPIITDSILVDMKFGTGAVKVTPAHDWNDFATGKRHKLAEINILNKDGTMNENAGSFAGLDRKRARTAVKKALDEKGLARGTKPHVLTLPKCQRSGGVVEPMISTQWFLSMKKMADDALLAVRAKNGEKARVEIIPDEWIKTYDHFLENIQDWCVSRQLWWGHQIPAWHGPDGKIVVAHERPKECGEADGWTQDPDVLDTWFSSALWPFATLGWPEKTKSLARFYPTNPRQTSDLETGYDILFFWVARMIMFGLHFTGEVPFRRVLLSGLIVDETGDKMSKVKGNVIDPLDLINGTTFAEMVKKTLPGAPEAEALSKFQKAYPSAANMGDGFPAFGADALRFTLSTFPPSNKRIALAPKRLEGYRHFINKIWNATRLVFDLAKDTPMPAADFAPTHFYNRWIVSRLAHVITVSNAGIVGFRVDECANEVYRFFWTEYCDWFLEIAKGITREIEGVAPKDAKLVLETKQALLFVLETSLRVMHPLMPFVTEELWQRMPKSANASSASANAAKVTSSIALAKYPKDGDLKFDADVDKQMNLLMSVIVAARTIRAEHEIKPASRVTLELHASSDASRAFLEAHRDAIALLAKADKLVVVARGKDARAKGFTVSVVPDGEGTVDVLLDLKGHVTKDGELLRIDRKLKQVEKDFGLIEKKLGNKGFVDRAPKEVIDEAHAQRKALLEARARLEEAKKLAEELA